jgi:6-pyruvoyltetrahydropterin/6-carboxytetrahydropterin synthase
MPESYHVRIAKERLVFSAAHFITYNGDVCEPLHGHNYHVTAEVHGALDENHYVVDFIAVRDALQRIVDSLDHRVLLPTEHPTIHVAEVATRIDKSVGEAASAAGPTEIVAQHGDRRWVFPRADCVLLPVANTTAELLARYIGGELLSSLDAILPAPPARLEVAVDECDGQWGVYAWQPD